MGEAELQERGRYVDRAIRGRGFGVGAWPMELAYGRGGTLRKGQVCGRGLERGGAPGTRPVRGRGLRRGGAYGKGRGRQEEAAG